MRRQTALLLVSLACSAFALRDPSFRRRIDTRVETMRNPLLQEVHGIRWPDGVEILHKYSGKEHDHLGIGLAALGDVDGDGFGDFGIGAMKWAYCFGFG